MKEIFGSIIFLVIVSGIMFSVVWWKDTAEQKQETRPSIGTLAQNTSITPSTSVQETSSSEEEIRKDDGENKTQQSGGAQPETAKDKLDVKVMNGGAAKGSAGKISEFLKTSGYTAVKIGNAVGDYIGVTVYYLDGNQGNAEALKQALAKDYPQVQTKTATSSKTEEGSAPVVVMVGK